MDLNQAVPAGDPADAPAPVLLCGPCISDARTAELLNRPPEEIHPAVTVLGGTAICDRPGRHRINVQLPGSTLIIPQNGMPGLS